MNEPSKQFRTPEVNDTLPSKSHAWAEQENEDHQRFFEESASFDCLLKVYDLKFIAVGDNCKVLLIN